jgi:glycolate oxidase FAD binding subunit
MPDQHKHLAEQITDAFRQGKQLRIMGHNSKSFLCHENEGEKFSTLEHSGIISYEPSELVVTVRAGTGIQELQAILAEQQQTLAFDPPCFNAQGTIGGAIATGLSGPSRPWNGSARDFVLGTRIINGKGEILAFGGQVMKNVAGYDVSRLMAGAYGSLGLILDISIKVLPLPEQTLTIALEQSADQSIEYINRLSGQSLPLTGACWMENKLYVRIAGTEAGIQAARSSIGGEEYDDDQFWNSLRDHKHDFYINDYWRIALSPATRMLPVEGQWLIEWGGAQRWLRSAEPAENILRAADQVGGHAQHWKHGDPEYLRPQLDPLINKYHQRLKDTFDPDRILNRGVMYRDL